MLQGGFFIGGIGGGNGSGGVGGSSSDVYLDNEGNIIYAPFDPIYIDDNGDIFLSEENKNSRLYIEDEKIFAERLV